MESYSCTVVVLSTVILTVLLCPTSRVVLADLQTKGQGNTSPAGGAKQQDPPKPSSGSNATAPVTTTPVITTRVPIPTGVEGVPNFVVYDGSSICLRVMMNAQMLIHYQTHNDLKPTRQLDATIRLPESASVSGQCGVGARSITLSWDNSSLTFNFTPVKKDNIDRKLSVAMWSASKITFRFDARNSTMFPGIKKAQDFVTQTANKELHFQTPANFSYTCASQEDMTLYVYNNNQTSDTSIISDVQLSVWDTKIQAFQLSPDGTYSEPAVCKPDIERELPKQNIVPLAVAACLAGLILVIVVAYFFVKNRTQSVYRAMD